MAILKNLFGPRTPKGDELVSFASGFPTDVSDQLRRYIADSNVAILQNGNDAGPFADIISLTVSTAQGKGPYRGTVKIYGNRVTGSAKKDPWINYSKLILVDLNYDEGRRKIVEREFTRPSYRLNGLAYFSAYPHPRIEEVSITPVLKL